MGQVARDGRKRYGLHRVSDGRRVTLQGTLWPRVMLGLRPGRVLSGRKRRGRR